MLKYLYKINVDWERSSCPHCSGTTIGGGGSK